MLCLIPKFHQNKNLSLKFNQVADPWDLQLNVPIATARLSSLLLFAVLTESPHYLPGSDSIWEFLEIDETLVTAVPGLQRAEQFG